MTEHYTGWLISADAPQDLCVSDAYAYMDGESFDYATVGEIKAIVDLGVLGTQRDRRQSFDSRFHHTLMIGRVLRAVSTKTFNLNVVRAFVQQDLYYIVGAGWTDRARAVLALIAACDPEHLTFNGMWHGDAATTAIADSVMRILEGPREETTAVPV